MNEVEEELDREEYEDFHVLSDGDVLTDGTSWQSIGHHLKSGRKVYHRYTDENDKLSEWQYDWLYRLARIEKNSLISKCIEDGEFYEILNEIELSHGSGGYGDCFYVVWSLKPETNKDALTLLTKEPKWKLRP